VIQARIDPRADELTSNANWTPHRAAIDMPFGARSSHRTERRSVRWFGVFLNDANDAAASIQRNVLGRVF